MILEKSKNAKRNMLFGFINKIVGMLLPFIVRTIIIKYMGEEFLGLNSLFTSILQVLSLSELGFSSAVTFSMYKPIAEDNKEAICSLLNFYRKVYYCIGAIVLTVGLLIMPFLKHLIMGEIPPDINIYVLYLFYLASTVSSYWLFGYKTALLNGYQRQDVISNVLSITQIIMYVLQIVAIHFTRNYYIYLVMTPICTILNNLINSYIVDRIYPDFKCNGKIQDRELSSIKKQVPGLMINKLCYISRNSFDSIFISAFLGLNMSAVYGNYYYIMNAIVAILLVVSNAVLAGVGNSQVTMSVEKNYDVMKKMNFIYMWISGFCTISLLCIYQPFMKLWVGQTMMFDYSTVILISLYFYALEMGVVRGVYSDAAGLWWENRYRAIIESIVNLILNYVFVLLWGINGIVIATLLSLFIINFCWGSQIVFKHYFKSSKKMMEYYRFHAVFFLVTTVIAVITVLVCSGVNINKWADVIVKIVICAILPNILYVVIFYHTEMYAESIKWILCKFNLDRRLSFLIPNRSNK